jgi:hypothetical protein
MRSLDSVLQSYSAARQCQQITSNLLRKTRNHTSFHGTVFFGESLDDATNLIGTSTTDLDDLFIVLLIATFEQILFKHSNPPLMNDLERHDMSGVTAAIAHFENQVSPPLYEAITQLCEYRHWVAHGKRWSPQPPQPAGPKTVHQQLTDFLVQAKLAIIPSSTDF